ncbi:MAG: tRNA 4-thiouridine(8) synthase ThiI, partial [Deltaproteobacteria bacterium]|nr:tRNA 4-thiouridine(8) synthase ThiI [Deltaproteobacteria bacterium]
APPHPATRARLERLREVEAGLVEMEALLDAAVEGIESATMSP